MKMRTEWGPADTISIGFSLGISCTVLFAFGYGVATAVSDKVIEYRHGESWNKRGYIKCIDGHLEIGNIDLGDLKKSILIQDFCAEPH